MNSHIENTQPKPLSYVASFSYEERGEYVGKTLDSMASQTIRPLEWVIVNDGSTDKSGEIVESYSARHRWIRLLNLPGLGDRQPEHYGGHVVDLIYDGLKERSDEDVRLYCEARLRHFV